MAIFKVGQRVRVLVSIHWPEIVGKEATITEIDGDGEYVLHIHGMSDPCDGGYWAADGNGDIAPLTDPLADAFIERIKRLEPLKDPSHV